jgi:hypothetical protein
MFDGNISKGVFSGPFGAVAVPHVTKAANDVYAIRYDRVRVQALGTTTSGPALKATYIASEYLGSSVMNFFETADGKLCEVEHHLSLGAPETYEPRQEYLLTWAADQAIVFGREGKL